MQKDKELFDSMRNIVILNSLHFSYPLPILMRVSYNTLIVKQNTSDYYKYNHIFLIGEFYKKNGLLNGDFYNHNLMEVVSLFLVMIYVHTMMTQ